MWGRSVCTTTLGLRGSVTSTPVKFLGAASCASHMMRRPSRVSCIAMPSPKPPYPCRVWWDSSFMFKDSVRSAWAAGEGAFNMRETLNAHLALDHIA